MTLLIFASLLGPLIAAQVAPPLPLQTPILTVCEIITNIDNWRDKDVVVVGILGFTFEGSFLDGRCSADGHVLLHGQKWLSLMRVHFPEANVRGRSLPVSDDAIRRKVREIVVTTPRRTEEGITPGGSDALQRKSIRINLDPVLVAMYGRVESPGHLIAPEGGRRGNGYGARGSVAAQICVITWKEL